MTNRFNNEVGGLGPNAQRPGKGTGDDPQRVRLLVQRLRIEAALHHLNFATWVSANQILLKGRDHHVIITVYVTGQGDVTVQIRAVLGEVMLAGEAKVFAARKNPSIRPREICVDEEGAVSILWWRTFAAEVDPSTVLDGLGGVGRTVDSIRSVLEEEFYLKPPDSPA